ncbi:MAG: hypothetical protein HYY76_02070 [Acidobacteria bacterium]|nr:hypothetical protein [Acidobacteriota bacterium]
MTIESPLPHSATRSDDHSPPGHGVVDWRGMGRNLVEAHFDGWIILELHCPAGSLAEQFARARAQLDALSPSDGITGVSAFAPARQEQAAGTPSACFLIGARPEAAVVDAMPKAAA